MLEVVKTLGHFYQKLWREATVAALNTPENVA